MGQEPSTTQIKALAQMFTGLEVQLQISTFGFSLIQSRKAKSSRHGVTAHARVSTGGRPSPFEMLLFF